MKPDCHPTRARILRSSARDCEGEVCDFSLLLLFLNAPASAFGHTLLRINKDATAKSGKRFELLDQGINFAAVMTTQNPVIYAVKGVFGFSRHVYERPLLLQGA